MFYEEKTIFLKNGKIALLRAPKPTEGRAMIEYLRTCTEETDFLLLTPEECTMTEEEENNYLTSILQSEYSLMIVAEVDGEIAGNCQINFLKPRKTSHRAIVGIALIKKYWNLGIGTAMFEELFAVARKKGVSCVELDYIEGNQRAAALYTKMGFETIHFLSDAIRQKDGTSLKEFHMTKIL